MKTLLICNQKGGVGKTLIADQVSFLLEQDGIPFSFVDLDQQGGSIHEPINNPDALVTVVDTPGALQADTIKNIKSADMIIIPTRASFSDQPALEKMIHRLRENNIQKPVLFVINCLNRYSQSQAFVEWFQESYPELKFLPLSQSELFASSVILKKSVCQIKSGSQVAQQINNIYGVVKYELQLVGKEKSK